MQFDYTVLYASFYQTGGILGIEELFSMDWELNVPGRIFTRSVYTFVDWLSDVGGLFGTVSVFVIGVLGLYTPKVYSVEVVRENFKIRPKRNHDGIEPDRLDLSSVS
jgi:hypothetical protein